MPASKGDTDGPISVAVVGGQFSPCITLNLSARQISACPVLSTFLAGEEKSISGGN